MSKPNETYVDENGVSWMIINEVGRCDQEPFDDPDAPLQPSYLQYMMDREHKKREKKDE